MTQETILTVEDIQQVLPHRYPFLMIDRVVEIEDNQRIVGVKNVTANEPYFQGHFPGRPIMPGVMMLEAMAQAAAILAKKSTKGVPADCILLFVGANDVKFRRPVTPGDILRVEMRFVRSRRPFWTMEGDCKVDGRIVAEAEISAVEAK